MSKKYIIIIVIVLIVIFALCYYYFYLKPKQASSQSTITAPASSQNIDSLGNDTTNKTTAGKLVSNAGDFATSILGVTKNKLAQQNIDLANQELVANNNLATQQENDKKVLTWTIVIVIIAVIAIFAYVFVFKKHSIA